MKYIVYKTTCLVNQKYYIGVHKTEDPDIFDGYLGRGFYKQHSWYIKHPESPLHYAIIKYGVENFSRETLFIYDNEKSAYDKEEEIVTEEFIKDSHNYNVCVGGKHPYKPGRQVFQFDFSGHLINTYENALAASKIVKVDISNINDAINHKRTSANSLWSTSNSINISEYQITECYKYYIYDSDGTFVQEFNSNQECIEYLNTNRGNLTRAIKLQNKISGYFISTEKYDKIRIQVTKLNGKLNRYTLDGKYIDSFNSIAEARQKLGLKLCSISQAIRLKRQCNGFRWTRTDCPTDTIEVPNK